jgi:hypothetical protein
MKRTLSLVAVLAIAGCSLLHSPPAAAGTITVTWTNPTTNADPPVNSPIPDTQGLPEALQTWRIEYGTCSAGNTFGTKLGEFTRARATGGAPLTTATNNVPPGNTCVRVYVANFAGNESVASNVAVRNVPASTPGPVTNVQAVLGGG